MRILITAGGTSEPIDSVRSITNHSTGRLGVETAKAFAADGAVIDYITTAYAKQPPQSPDLTIYQIESTAQLLEQMKTLMTAHPYDAVIHSMAVSDFTPEASYPQEALAEALQQALSDSGAVAAAVKQVLTSLREYRPDRRFRRIRSIC